MTLPFLERAAAVFVLLSFVHFFMDFICQTSWEALTKHCDPLRRAVHCTVYTLGFFPLLWALHVPRAPAMLIALGLWLTHFVLDTYRPVYLWAKYIRRAPEVRDWEGFSCWAHTPLGQVLSLAVDQIMHLAVVWGVSLVIASTT